MWEKFCGASCAARLDQFQLVNSYPIPHGLQVFERGWLSSNSIYLGGDAHGAILIDTGYCIHAEQTAALLEAALQSEAPDTPLRLIVNTHLHSDHCGGNAFLRTRHRCSIAIPPGDFDAARNWDAGLLSYEATGQQCPRFTPDFAIRPGECLQQAGREWQVHAAAGHDPHSIILFEPESRVLISADALWERGFGIVFPEIDGVAAFDEVAASLDLIESLDPGLVIPGHGMPFSNLSTALAEARSRLSFFSRRPDRHARHAAKALIMFHLLEVVRQTKEELLEWLEATPIQQRLWDAHFQTQSLRNWSTALVNELERAGVIHNDGEILLVA
jgi:glyoxylase-like metal-dependent hydrolase (beta-lactamase superfamily II)